MTWSINWDRYYGWEFSKNFDAYFWRLTGQQQQPHRQQTGQHVQRPVVAP